MPKDRFSKFKPINWNTGFKQTGSFIKHESPSTPKKSIRTLEQNNVLYHIFDSGKEHMSEWELTFFNSILSVPYQISLKQKEVIKGVIKKYDLEKPAS